MDDAPIVQGGESLSVGSGQLTREFLNYTLTIDNPVDRLPAPGAIPPPFALTTGVARFLWLMSGSSRLESIRHYSQGVTRFTDDGFVVPGSSYGERLFYVRPGLDQISNAVRILKDDPSSRRAVATVFQPEDTVRESRDIPCTYGLSYHIRDGVLHATTIMRSNNAWTLLPYNVFEFSLLAEVVACRIGVPLGTYTHHCLSLHIYDSDFDAIMDWLAADAAEGSPMDALPDLVLHQKVGELLRFEERVRAEYTSVDGNTVRAYLRDAAEFGPVLSDFAVMLLIHAARKAGRTAVSDSLVGRIAPALQAYIPRVGVEQPELPLG